MIDSKARLAIMAFDPGGTTGWCATSFRLGHLALLRERGLKAFLMSEALTLTSGQLTGSENSQALKAADLIQAGVDRGEADYVLLLYEDFILRQKRKDRDLLSPVRMTAKLEMVNELNWGFPELKQQPSLAKTSMPNSRLKALKLYRPAMPHANDGIRHNVTLIRRFAQKPNWLEKVLNG
jgi:hypothetical protein